MPYKLAPNESPYDAVSYTHLDVYKRQPLQYVQIASSKFLSAINPLETRLLQLFIRVEETEEHLFKLQ